MAQAECEEHHLNIGDTFLIKKRKQKKLKDLQHMKKCTSRLLRTQVTTFKL